MIIWAEIYLYEWLILVCMSVLYAIHLCSTLTVTEQNLVHYWSNILSLSDHLSNQMWLSEVLTLI